MRTKKVKWIDLDDTMKIIVAEQMLVRMGIDVEEFEVTVNVLLAGDLSFSELDEILQDYIKKGDIQKANEIKKAIALKKINMN